MGPFIGFVVLTSPLFLIILWIPVCIALAVWIGRKFIKTGLPLKIVGGTLIFLVSMILPFADEIAGRIYFNHLCETKAGVKVYKTIELPAEYWDEKGNPRFYTNWDANLGKEYPLFYKGGKFSKLLNIDNSGYKFVDNQSGGTLGEVVDFRYWGGWLRNNFSPHNTATSCKFDKKIINDIFIPENKGKGVNHGNNQ